MKTFLFAASLILIASLNYSASFNSELDLTGVDPETESAEFNGSVNKAKGAIRSTCPNATGQLTQEVQVIANYDGSTTTRVVFWKGNNGQGNQSSQQAEYVGTVTLDDNNNVVSVACANEEPPGYF